MIVDGLWVSVGSTNFDSRSFSLNDEANLNIFDANFASRQIKIFQQDVARSKPVTLSEWQQRPVGEKLLDTLASLLQCNCEEALTLPCSQSYGIHVAALAGVPTAVLRDALQVPYDIERLLN